MYCTSHNTEYTAQQLQLWYTSNISNACDCYCWPRTEGRRSRGLPFPPVLWWPNTAKCKIIKACARYTGQACLSHTHIQSITGSLPMLHVHTDRTHAHTAKHRSNRMEHDAWSFWTHCCEDSWWTKASGRGGVQSPSTWCTQMEHNTKRSTHFNSGTEKMLLTKDEVK